MTASGSDNIYAQPLAQVSDFTFDQQVVEVFPDMIQRSVPGYVTIVSAIGELAGRFCQPESTIYDLGCSLGAATIAMRRCLHNRDNSRGVKIVAVDNSPAMIERCRLHVDGFRSDIGVEINEADINDIPISNASVVVMNFTMQFLAPQQRRVLVDKIYRGLRPGGVFILSEKVNDPDPLCNELLIDLHHEFKRANGYSELEISQKRAAIENVMKIESVEQHRSRLQQAGFEHISTWYQCFNFSSLVAIK